MRVISVRENPEYLNETITYFQDKWASKNTMKIYEDCISHSIDSNSKLPEWYLLKDGNKIVGCAGLITNDFISRMDLYPWICAVYIDKDHRGQRLSSMLIDKAKSDAEKAGFDHAYLSTDHIGFYEKYGFEYIADGYHPWGDSSRIYSIKTGE